MSSKTPGAGPDALLSLEDRIDILFHELELAVRWDRPSILFAIYRSDAVRDEVNARLQGMLAGQGQSLVYLKTQALDRFDFLAQSSALGDLSRSVLVIDGFKWECGPEGVHVFQEFNKHREVFIDNSLRAIFWLFENEVSGFAANATECWILRHRVVEFVDLPGPEDAPFAGFSAEQGDDPHAEDASSEAALGQEIDLQDPSPDNASRAGELLSLGLLHWRKARPAQALQYLQAAAGISTRLSDHSLLAQCQNALALVYSGLGEVEDAIAAYHVAISLLPESAFLWINLGRLLARNERNEEAISAYRKALDACPNDFLAWDGLGQVCLKMGLVENSIDAFGNALQAAPFYSFSWAGLGQAHLQAGSLDQAVATLGKAVELDPSAISTWLDLASCFIQLEQDDQALVTYHKAIGFHPAEPRLWDELGRFHLQRHEYVESIAAFRKVVSLAPGSGEALIRLAFALDQIGDYEASAMTYEQSIPFFEGADTCASIWNRLGDTYLRLKDYDKAVQAYDRSRALQQEPQPQDVAAGDTLPVRVTPKVLPAQAPATPPETKQPERGPDMNEANQVFDSRTAREWNEVGNIHLKAGAYNDAIVAYTRAIELAPEACWAYIQNLAQVHYQKGKARGKVAQPQVEDPDLWEAEEESDPASLFGPDILPLPERGDNPAGAGGAGLVSPPSVGAAAEPPCACPAESRASSTAPVQADPVPAPAASQPARPSQAPSRLALGASAPRNSIDWNELGNSYTRLRQFNEAILAYKKAIEMNPRFGQPYSNLGLLYYHLGRFDVAVLLFKRSIELLEASADKAAAWNKLGDSYRRLGDYGNALTAYQRSSEMAPPSSPLMARARATLLENIVAG